MRPENYFKRHGCIYGVSSKYSFGKWTGYTVRFTDFAKAERWLNINPRERKLVSETKADNYEKMIFA